jgi:hypothetical protein
MNFFQPSLFNNAVSRSTNLPRSEGSLPVSTVGLGTGSFRDVFIFFMGGCEGATNVEGCEKVVGFIFKTTALLLVLPTFQFPVPAAG